MGTSLLRNSLEFQSSKPPADTQWLNGFRKAPASCRWFPLATDAPDVCKEQPVAHMLELL